MFEVQLNIFEDSVSEEEHLRMELKQLRESQDNLRRGLFARHNELCNKYIELRMDYEKLSADLAKIQSIVGI